MELTLTRQVGTQVAVICDNKPSHTFDLHTLITSSDKGAPQVSFREQWRNSPESLDA